MDVNGLRHWQVADARGFALDTASSLRWDTVSRTLRLSSQQAAPVIAEDRAFAVMLANRPSPVSDAGGSFAWWDGVAGSLRAAGFGIGDTPIELAPDSPPGVVQPTDLAFGDDDVLYVARNGGIIMLDRRDRWPPARIDLEGFAAHRLAPAAGGGVWALDRTTRQIARLNGYPLRRIGIERDISDRFNPKEPNPRPPRLRLLRGARLPAGAEGVAIAASAGGQLAVLAWRTGETAQLFLLDGRKLTAFGALAGIASPYGLAWDGETGVAVLASDGAAPARQAYVYEVADRPRGDAEALPSGAIHPLLGIWNGNFCNRLGEIAVYPAAGANADTPGELRRLLALSRAGYARGGRTLIGPFDGGREGFVWHRLYLEASLPPGAGVRIWAHADESGARPDMPSGGDDGWFPHLGGNAAEPPAFASSPRAAWCPEASELPHAAPLLSCPAVADQTGLFTILLQRTGRRVRRLTGRWLWLTIELEGDALATPEIAALRAYGERFAYRDRYLPAFYREAVGGSDADANGAATRHDFLDRFLGLFEAPLTRLEGDIAESWLLTDPGNVPEASLDWLGSWIGVTGGHREALKAAPWTARLHGTAGGVLAALELATGGRLVLGGRIDPFQPVPRPGQLAQAQLDGLITRALVLGVTDPAADRPSAVLVGGAVTRGEIVLVEGWRLRRTFATILGADLADENDPLTGGLQASGNSFVGDTLILGDEARREFMALFSADLPQSGADRRVVVEFFERLAHRVIILVRHGARTADLERLAEIAEAETPAHVETQIFSARQPLMVGAASLTGIDTFLLPAPKPRPARVGRTALGKGDQVTGTGRLDARADGPLTARPVAAADGPAESLAGQPFLLSALRSEAAPGRSIARNIWTWNPE